MSRRVLPALVLSCLLFAPVARAAEPMARLTGYSLAAWTERDGEPIGPIRALVQDRIGYLWLGTDAGLVRFDGVRFATAESLGYDLPRAAVQSLWLSPGDHALWIGFDGRQGVRVLRKGQVEDPGDGTALRTDVLSLIEDREGTIWAGTDDGVRAYRGGRWERVATQITGPDRSIRALHLDASNRLWVATISGLFRWNGTSFELIDAAATAVRSIETDRRGRLWITDPVAGFRQSHEARGTSRGGAALGSRIFEDSHENLWILTRGQGLWRMRPGHASDGGPLEAATVDTGLTSNGLWAVIEDREGNLWFGTQHGLNRLTPHAVTPVVGLGLVASVAAHAGEGVWAGTAAGLVHVTDSARTTVALGSGATEVTALHVDRQGIPWAASSRGVGRVVNGRFESSNLPGLSSLTRVRSITGDGRTGLWLVDLAAGLVKWDGTRTREVIAAAADARPLFAHADRRHRLWVALRGGRVAVLDDAGEPIGSAGLPEGTHSAINTIFEDQHGTIWIGGNRGLTRFADNRFTTLSAATGFPWRSVSAIAEDGEGFLWLAVDGSIVRLHPSQYELALTSPSHRFRFSQFDPQRGVAGVPVGRTNAAVTRAADGDVWFVTGWGLTRITPRAIPAEDAPEPLPVRIEMAVADGERLAAVDGVRLPARTARVVVDYTALQLTSPSRIRFRYKLEGFDRDWVEAGTRRQAVFTNLPPRTYRFSVQAESGDGSWTPADASWVFAIAPMFYETYSFYALLMVLTGGAWWATWRLRLRHVRREYGLVLAERARLSREIHDTLLQNLAGVAIQCAGISNSLDSASPARSQLNTVRRQVETYVRDMRQAVWDLRAPLLETHDLASALRQFGGHTTGGTSITFALAVAGRPRQLAAKVENDVLRVGQEAIRNAVRHSGATHIRVDLLFEDAALRLRVSDNGCGFDFSHQASDRHFGLIGMRERAAEMGGRLNFATPPAGGTNVELVIPADPLLQRA